MRHIRKEEGLRCRRIRSITLDSFKPNWASIASNAVLSSQAISIILEMQSADSAAVPVSGLRVIEFFMKLGSSSPHGAARISFIHKHKDRFWFTSWKQCTYGLFLSLNQVPKSFRSKARSSNQTNATSMVSHEPSTNTPRK